MKQLTKLKKCIVDGAKGASKFLKENAKVIACTLVGCALGSVTCDPIAATICGSLGLTVGVIKKYDDELRKDDRHNKGYEPKKAPIDQASLENI